MVHYVLIKRINKKIRYFISKKNHPIIMDMLKSKFPKFWDGFFYAYPNGLHFKLKISIK